MPKDKEPNGAEAEVSAEVAALKSRVAELETENQSLKRSEFAGLTVTQVESIRARMKAGLTREQAESAERNQRDWDQDPKNPKNAKP